MTAGLLFWTCLPRYANSDRIVRIEKVLILTKHSRGSRLREEESQSRSG